MTNLSIQTKAANAAKASTAMTLYFVQHENDDGDNVDLFVRADHVARAIDLWRGHFELSLDDVPERVFAIAGDAQEEGALHWHAQNCRQVWPIKSP